MAQPLAGDRLDGLGGAAVAVGGGDVVEMRLHRRPRGRGIARLDRRVDRTVLGHQRIAGGVAR